MRPVFARGALTLVEMVVTLVVAGLILSFLFLFFHQGLLIAELVEEGSGLLGDARRVLYLLGKEAHFTPVSRLVVKNGELGLAPDFNRDGIIDYTASYTYDDAGDRWRLSRNGAPATLLLNHVASLTLVASAGIDFASAFLTLSLENEHLRATFRTAISSGDL